MDKIRIWKEEGFTSSTKSSALGKLFNYMQSEEMKKIFTSTDVPVFKTLKAEIKADMDELKTYKTLGEEDPKGTFAKIVDTALTILLNAEFNIKKKAELLDEVG
ncbi:hypothetical protein Ciccas_004795 [Cichlidogyrus casuarinus]|uniref:Uncharacterized protein n=1 Tax=Cichlidogyrus casuarinus TaxID=1844966 RepID=A0ABD2QCS7_9PLAT